MAKEEKKKNNQKSEQEYNDLKKQQDQYKEDEKKIEKKRDDLLNKLERLKNARDAVRNNKKSYSKIISRDERITTQDRKWRGQNYRNYGGYGKIVVNCNNNYYDELDRIHDCLNNEITSVKNQLTDTTTLLGRITCSLRNIGTKINNFWN